MPSAAMPEASLTVAYLRYLIGLFVDAGLHLHALMPLQLLQQMGKRVLKSAPLERAAAKAKSKIAKTADLAGFSEWLGRDGPALFEPGAHFGYSDVHTAVAHIVERVSGMGFEAYLQQQRQVCMFISEAQAARIDVALQALGVRGVSIFGSSVVVVDI